MQGNSNKYYMATLAAQVYKLSYQRKYFLLHTSWYFSFQQDKKRKYGVKVKGFRRNIVSLEKR